MLIAAWLLATNHCALTPATAGTMAQCPHHHPAGGKSDGGCRACCQVLKAPGLLVKKSPVNYDTHLFTATIFFAAVVMPGGSFAAEGEALDTGPPPRSVTFAESVLQRSLRAHAPPLSLA